MQLNKIRFSDARAAMFRCTAAVCAMACLSGIFSAGHGAPEKMPGRAVQPVKLDSSGVLTVPKKKIAPKLLDEMEYMLPSSVLTVVTADSLTFQGKLFYNDLRTGGRFEFRKDENGNTGAGTTWSCTPKGARNYLGALDVVADFYEVDISGSGSSCKDTERIGSATVGTDGSYSISFSDLSALDACPGDGDSKIQIAVSFRLRFCNTADDSTPDRCFSVGPDVDDPYVLWHTSATDESPLEISVSRKGTYDLGAKYFKAKSADGDPEDMYAQAANYYASLVDTTRVWHREGGVPFQTSYGEVYLVFPSAKQEERASGAACTTYSATEMHCLDPEPDDDDVTSSCPEPEKWTNGEVIMHEYGHTLHDRAWDGTTGDCGDCPGGQYSRGESCGSSCSWGATTLEYPHPAFTEGWANFVSKVVRGECESDFDDNATSDGAVMPTPGSSDTAPYAPEEGEAYARNVTKLLCDWYDSQGDDDPDRAGKGDHFAADTLYSVWYNLNKVWSYYDDNRDDGLNLCHYVNYYLYKRKGADAVGDETHNNYMASIADLSYNNGVSCDLPEPKGDIYISSVVLDGGFSSGKTATVSSSSKKTVSKGKMSGTKRGKFKVTVKNKDYPYKKTVELSGPKNKTRDVAIDPSDKSDTASFTLQIATDASGMPESSEQTLTWTLDPDEDITDTKRSNNTYTVSLKPDYKASITRTSQQCFGAGAMKIKSACFLYVSCEASNEGYWDGLSESAISLKVEGLSETRTATQSIAAIAAGDTDTARFSVMIPSSTNATLTLTCTADAQGALSEVSESNNSAAKQVRITSGSPDTSGIEPPEENDEPLDRLQP